MKKYMLIAIAMICCTTTISIAGGTVSIRLIKASNDGSNTDSRLSDVIPVLKRSLVFKKYSLIASSSLKIPASGQAKQVGGYTVTCKGSQRSLGIQVKKNGTSLLNTTASLSRGKPLIIGGFPSQNGRMILVFLLR